MKMIRLPADGSYFETLAKRLEHFGISHAEVAEEMRPPRDPSQFSKWIRGEHEPRLSIVVDIETAVVRIRARRRKAALA